jgi:putative intracellular protease/amidase
MRILMVVTSHAELGDTGLKTGFWLEELAVPYRVFVAAGAEVDIASPAGGTPPADPKSVGEGGEVAAFLADPVAKRKLDATLRLEPGLAAGYDAIVLAGGHGVMWDLPDSAPLAAILAAAESSGAVIAAVCHGPAGLVNARRGDGQPLVAGRRVTGFSDAEEVGAELDKVVPFMLAQKLTELGGIYEHGPMWQPHAVRDGRLVTGQNPASSRRVAEEVLAALRER